VKLHTDRRFAVGVFATIPVIVVPIENVPDPSSYASIVWWNGGGGGVPKYTS
jgi:hypothetical protein